MTVAKLDQNAVEQSLQDLNEGSLGKWVLTSDGAVSKIEKTFLFDDFRQAFSFMTRCADYTEKINHHPEWTNIYNKVVVRLTTHDVDGLSVLDFKMAGFMDASFINASLVK